MTTKQRLSAAQRATQAIDLRVHGHSWEEIAVRVGYANSGNACRAVTDALRKAPAAAASDLRVLENHKLDVLELEAWKLLRGTFYATCAKGLVLDDDGEPLIDPAPRDKAINTLLRIAQRRARLNGLDAPTTIKLENDDALNADIEAGLAWLLDRSAPISAEQSA